MSLRGSLRLRGKMETIVTPSTDMIVAPLPERNEVDAVGQRSAAQIARSVVEFHQAGLASRRNRDLISEKLLLHIDGSQWCDIVDGQRVEIPRLVSEYRQTDNILRLVVDNAVAHHTTMPLRFYADSQPDRKSRDQSIIDTLWINHTAQQQDFNGLFADAMYLATPAGFCPVHCYWRNDQGGQYEPINHAAQDGPEQQLIQLLDPQPGRTDCWLGNPWDTVFDRNAKRGSIHRCTYGRVLPADMVRAAFSHIPGASNLEGTTKIPSAAQFQRIARSWQSEGLGTHGSSVLTTRRNESDDEESMLLVCDEVLPGVDPDWPWGRLRIVAVPGAADLRRATGSNHAFLLADQPLPAGVFSFALFYSHHRGDDVHGKPWIEDIDELQVRLNILISKQWEFTNKVIDAPIVAPGGAIEDDMADLDGYSIMEIEPSLANWRPQVLKWDGLPAQLLEKQILDVRQAIFRGGGYQAASRGEQQGTRQPYRAIVALQQADNTIHGPVNQRFRRSAADFARINWMQMKTFGDVPHLVDIAGAEYSYLVEPYIDNTKLSDRVPRFKLVDAFGPSPELKAQEILQLMGTRGADGQPFLSTEEAQRLYPNQGLLNRAVNPKFVAIRRAKTVANAAIHLAEQFRQDNEFDVTEMNDPWVLRAGLHIFMQLEKRYRRMRNDNLQAHLDAYAEITQDETADAIARTALERRADLYYQWQADMAAQMVQQSAAPALGRQPEQTNQLDRQGVAQDMGGMPDEGRMQIVATAR